MVTTSTLADIKFGGNKTNFSQTVFVKGGNYRLIAETPVLRDGCELEIYVDANLIEVYANQGEAVISSVVYGLSDIIDGKAYTLYIIV